MRKIVLASLLFTMSYVPIALADGAQAREVARLNNCAPKKVEVYQQKVGADASTIFRVACNAPKTVNEKAPQTANAVLVQCSGSICEVLRPLFEAVN